MLLGEIIRVALQSIRANFFRALLTMLGIIIGVAAVITMVSLGAGAQSAIDKQIEALGANILTVSASGRLTRGISRDRLTLIVEDAKALEAQGREIVHLEIGGPDFDTPQYIVEAGIKALRDGFTHYGPSAGMPPVRQAFAEYAGGMHGIDIDPDSVVVTPGAKPVMFFGMMSLVNPGDEDHLLEHPDIIDVAVVGMPDERWGESLAAFVVRGPGSSLTDAEVIDHCRRELADYKRPRRVQFLEEIPRNPTGKVLKRELREL